MCQTRVKKALLSEEKNCRKKKYVGSNECKERRRGAHKKNDDKHEYLFKIRGRLMSVNERALLMPVSFFSLSIFVLHENAPDNCLMR